MSAMGSQRSGGKPPRKLDASSFGRGSIDKGASGNQNIMNLSLSPNAMLGKKRPTAAAQYPMA